MSYKTIRFGKVLGALGLTVALAAGCSLFSGRESTGEYVDDAALTGKINAQIIGDATLKSSQINVETMQDVVQLSGFVDSLKAKERAGYIARNVEGVRSVKNNIIVRSPQ